MCEPKYISSLENCDYLFSLRSNGINFIDEDDGRAVLFGLFEGLPQVAFALAGQFAHNLGAIDEEKESACFVGNRSCNQGFAGT